MMQTQKKLLEEVEIFISNFFEENIGADYVYHDLLHTQYVVETAMEIGKAYELSEQAMEVLLIAAWFHDTGYVDGAEGHEERSATIAKEFLRPLGYDEEELEKIAKLIIATKLPHSPKNLGEKVICDADLSHLGSKEYWDRCGRVRQELLLTRDIVMSEQEWVDFELEFMTKHKFHTNVARNLFEKRKQKHIRQLKKQKLRLNPEDEDLAEELEEQEKRKKKKKKKKTVKGGDNDHQDLKRLNLGRGVETMYRTTYRTHVNLSSIADNKANIMLSINAIIISIVVTNLVPRFADRPELILPTFVLLSVCLTALVFAILSTRPKITEGKFTREDIENKRSNLLFFGNFYNMQMEDFHWGMMEMIKDSDFLYSSMTRDLYYLGIVLAKKYRYLRICYSIFMYGLILSVIVFGITYIVFDPKVG